MQSFNSKELNNYILKDGNFPNHYGSGIIVSSNSCGERRNSGSSSVFTDKDSNYDKSDGNICPKETSLSYADNTTKCPHYLPSYIRWDGESEDYMYRNDKSAGIDWIRTKSLRDAEHKSGYPKKQWVECPMYARDPLRKGYKYIPRNDTVMMKKYVREFYPNSIKLKENEDINKIKRIWVYEDGFYSYQQEQRKKNLERNCTNGVRCPNMINGKCPYNHYVENGISKKLCSSDVGKKFSHCLKQYCSCDHSIDRVSRCSIIDFAIENGTIQPKDNYLTRENMIKVVELVNKGNICGMNIEPIQNLNDDYYSESEDELFNDNDSILSQNNSSFDVDSELTDDSYFSDEMEVENSEIKLDHKQIGLHPSFFKSQVDDVPKDLCRNDFRITVTTLA